MNPKRPVFLYEKFNLFGLGPLRFWIIFGATFFLAGRFFVRLDNLPGYWIIWAFYAMGFMLWPNLLIWMYRNFSRVLEAQKDVFWRSKKEYLLWAGDREEKIFTLSTAWSRIIILIVTIAAPASVLFLLLQFPGNDRNLVYLTALAFGPLAFIGGHAAYILLALMGCLMELSGRPIHVPFYRLPNPLINRLQTYYSIITIMLAGATVHVAAGLWLSPLGFPPVMLTWMTILSFYPLGMFLVSVFFTHKIIQNIKQTHLELINKEVQEVLERVTGRRSASGYEELSRVMEVQGKVQNMPEWPIEFSGTLTFAITLTTGIAQLVVSLINSS